MANKTKRVELRLSPTDYNILLSLQNRFSKKSRTEIIELALKVLAKQTKTYITMSFYDTFDTTIQRISEAQRKEKEFNELGEDNKPLKEPMEDNETIDDILKELDDIDLNN